MTESAKIRTANISIPIVVVLALIACTAWLNRELSRLSYTQRENTASISQVNDSVNALKNQSYSLAEASENSLRRAIANPGFREPDPRNPGEVIVVHQDRGYDAERRPGGGRKGDG